MRSDGRTDLNAKPRGHFFDVARIIRAKKPAIFVLENVKNLKSHDKGNTFRVIMATLDELGYAVADANVSGPQDPKIVDGKHFCRSTGSVLFWSVSDAISSCPHSA